MDPSIYNFRGLFVIALSAWLRGLGIDPTDTSILALLPFITWAVFGEVAEDAEMFGGWTRPVFREPGNTLPSRLLGRGSGCSWNLTRPCREGGGIPEERPRDPGFRTDTDTVRRLRILYLREGRGVAGRSQDFRIRSLGQLPWMPVLQG